MGITEQTRSEVFTIYLALYSVRVRGAWTLEYAVSTPHSLRVVSIKDGRDTSRSIGNEAQYSLPPPQKRRKEKKEKLPRCSYGGGRVMMMVMTTGGFLKSPPLAGVPGVGRHELSDIIWLFGVEVQHM